MFDFHGESFAAAKCFLNFSEKYSSSSYIALLYDVRDVYCCMWRRGKKKKKKEKRKLIHGAFKQGLPTKIFFHGLVHGDSRDP